MTGRLHRASEPMSGPDVRAAARPANALRYAAAFLSVACLSAGFLATACGRQPDRAAGADPHFFGHAQAWLDELDGQPLLAASWSGEFRPYVYAGGQYRPLVPDRQRRLARVDLHRPLALSRTEILMSGTAAGRPHFDIYLLRVGDDLPINLTATPDLDEGDLCARAGSRVVAYRAGDRQRFARVGGAALEPLAAPPVRGFDECAWLDDRRLVGIAGRRAPLALFECALDAGGVGCRQRPGALDGIERVNDLTAGDGAAYLTALARDGQFRAAFEIRPHPATVAALARPPVDGDVLDWSPDLWRIGSRGRYRSSLALDSPATIYRVRRIGGRAFAIAADPTTPRTLAVLEGQSWRLLPPPGPRPHADAPRELWTVSPRGERHQSFLFGPPDAERVVVWFHGGPHESVSPRFHPYFHALGELGTAVMAMNYPGSTGRGAAYEDRFADDALADALQSVWDELRRRRVTTVVAWSVSAGSRLPRILLSGGFPISAVVDQAGFDNRDLVKMAARAGVPLFAIRGRHDTFPPGTRVDHMYEGGHDITHPADFAALLAAVRPFLASAPPVTWTDPR